MFLCDHSLRTQTRASILRYKMEAVNAHHPCPSSSRSFNCSTGIPTARLTLLQSSSSSSSSCSSSEGERQRDRERERDVGASHPAGPSSLVDGDVVTEALLGPQCSSWSLWGLVFWGRLAPLSCSVSEGEEEEGGGQRGIIHYT